MSDELQAYESNGKVQAARQFTPKEVELLKRTICQGATDEELSLFIQQCKQYGLDPFTGQIHAVKRWDSSEGRKVMSVQVGIDGFRVIADRTGKWRGTVGPYWCGPDAEWTDVWLKDEPPAAAKVGVLRSDFAEPKWGIARRDAYCETKKNGQPTFMWQKMPAHMLAKCAESLALRSAFPNDLSGLYTDDEMSQAGGEVQEYTGPPPEEVQSVPANPTPDTVTCRGYEVREKAASQIEQADDKLSARDDVDALSEGIDQMEAYFRDKYSGDAQDAALDMVAEHAERLASMADASETDDRMALLDRLFDLAPAGSSANDSISESQLKRLFAIAQENDWSEAALNALVKDELGYESKKDIPRGNPYGEICEALESERLRYHMSRDPDTPDMFDNK